MRTREAAKVCERLWYLGLEESGLYLLEGRDGSMLISGGMSYIVPMLLNQFREFDIDPKRITKILILHAHFDHIGTVPFFKRTYPHITVYASARGWARLRMPEAIDTINAFSRGAAERMRMLKQCSRYDLDWRDDISGVPISEGQHIDLGDIEVHIIETPGHSSCSISAYIPKLKALFPSDGGGIPFKDTIITSGNSNYTEFQSSLEKLRGLQVDYLCADHYGYVTGDEAGRFIADAIKLAQQHRKKMEHVYRQTHDVDTAAKEMCDSIYAVYPDYFLSPDVFEGVYRQMMRHIAMSMEEMPDFANA